MILFCFWRMTANLLKSWEPFRLPIIIFHWNIYLRVFPAFRILQVFTINLFLIFTYLAHKSLSEKRTAVQNTRSITVILPAYFCYLLFDWRYNPLWVLACRLILATFWITLSDSPQSVGLLWTSDLPATKTSTRQHTTLTTDKHPCLRPNSNPQS